MSNDICFCGSEECPKYQKCYRGKGGKGDYARPRIFTFAYLGETCNKNSDYPDFIPVDKEGKPK